MLLAVYDFAASPTSFDIAAFLALADLERQRRSLSAMHVLFVPAPGTGFWENEALGEDEKRWRVRNLLIPMCWLWPACGGVTVLGSRDEARASLRRAQDAVFPSGYRLHRPVPDAFQWAAVAAERACGALVPSWVAPPQAREFVRRWLEPRARGRRVVVITLREAGYYSEVNSDLPAWGAFARSLDPERYLPVVLRDTEAIFAPVPPELQDLTLFPEASLNLELRAALFSAMFVGLSVPNGPMILQWLKPDCRFLIFRLLVPENFRARPTVMRSLGLEIGGQLPGATPFQRLIWEEDRFEVIRREFERIVGDIDAAAAGIGPAVRPDSGEPPLRLARRLRETHRLAAARRIYRHLIEQRQNRAAAHCGLCLLELATPRGFRIWRYLKGFYHYACGRMVQAESRWENADEALEIADARMRWRDWAAAEAIYRSILSQHGDQATALHRLGAIALRRGAADEAITLLKRAVVSDPHSAAAHYDLAEALCAAGSREDATRHYRIATSCDPSHRLARERLDDVAMKAGQEDVAA
jgi:Tetratricopeptide repeat